MKETLPANADCVALAELDGESSGWHLIKNLVLLICQVKGCTWYDVKHH